MLFGLVGIILICAVFLAQALKAKQDLIRERNDLQKEKISFENKVGSLETSLRSYETKITSLNNDLRKVSKEKEELQSKYELVNKAKDELVEKLKEASSSRPKVTTPVQQAAPQTNDAYWAGILQEKMDLEMQLANVRKELKSTAIANGQLEMDKGTLDLQIKSLKRENEDARRQMEYDKKMMQRQLDDEKRKIEQQLEDNKRMINSISQDLVIEKNDKMKIEENFKTIKNENAALIRQIENLNSRKTQLEEKLKQAQEDRSGLEIKFKDMEALLNNNLSQLDELKGRLDGKGGSSDEMPRPAARFQAAQVPSRKSSIELPAIVVRPQGAGLELMNRPAPAPAAPILVPASLGEVIAVNKVNNFVIINIGDASGAGIKMGDIFSVNRYEKKIGIIEVIKISKNVTACDIKKQDVPIKIGDLIK